MKFTTSIILLFISVTLYSQTENVVGGYYLKFGIEGTHLFEYKLLINEDGTFFFHSYSNDKKSIPAEVNRYGKGKWTVDGKVVSFFTDIEKDIDEKHSLDFRKTRARFITKSPRDMSAKIVKTRLKFFESEISWIEGIDIFKI